MKKNIGIYCANEWTGARDYANQLRSSGDFTVRIRNAAMFTGDEAFDEVHVHGDFPAVMGAYPDAVRIGQAAPEDAAEPEDGDGMTRAELKAALDIKGTRYAPGLKKAELRALLENYAD